MRMSRQSNLDGEVAGIDRTEVFFRPVSSEQTVVEPEKQVIDSPSELDDIEELIRVIQRDKLRYPTPVKDSKMGELASDRVSKILKDGPSESYVSTLLSMFCDSLEGRQRAKDKYAMLVYFGDSFLLAHVRAERGMSLKEDKGEIELIRRFLDIDNILSAAFFEDEGSLTRFSHFTDTGSDSFREFVGVRKQEYHYQKKNIQIICFYKGRRGIECKFEFSNDEFEDKWLNKDVIELSDEYLSLNGDESHSIKELRWGSETYSSVDVFKSDFKEYSFGLEGERNRYQRLLSNPSGSEASVYDDDLEEVIDRRHSIELRKKDGSSEIINKGNYPDDLHVLFAGQNVSLGSGFADRIFTDLTKNNEVSIYHPSQRPAPKEMQVHGIKLLNINEEEMSPETIDFVETTYGHAINNITGETVRKCLVTVILHMLTEEVDQSVTHGIKQLININTGNPRERDVVSTKENEGDGLIEFKNKKDLEIDDPADKIADNIKKQKSNQVDTKVFLWGITEETREINGLEKQAWGDDRIKGVEEHVEDYLSDEGIGYNDFIMQPIELGSVGDRLAIAGVFY